MMPDTTSEPPPIDYDEFNTMEKHYRDVKLNRYFTGPGSELPDELQPGALVKTSPENRNKFGIHLTRVSAKLTETGIRNLCGKYGKVVNVRMGTSDNASSFANVFFATAGDAENACRNINYNSLEMRASFYTSREKQKQLIEAEDTQNLNLPQTQAVDNSYFNQFEHPLSKPTSLDSFKPKPIVTENLFGNEPTMNTLLEEDQNIGNVVNGRISYRNLSDMKLQETFDAEKHEFVYGDGNFCEIGQCKNCGNPTLTSCKGCQDYFCSTSCRKEYKSCSCVSSNQLEMQIPNSFSTGRGSRIFGLRPPSSASSNESDTESIVSKLGKRMKRHNLYETVDPCPIPTDKTLVTITSVVSHNTFYLRPMESRANERYYLYLNDVVQSSKTAMPLRRIPKMGDIVLALFDGVYYRALILRIENNSAVVAFLEFGNVEKTCIDELKELRDDLKNVQRFIFKASLVDVKSQLKTDKCLIYLYNLMKKCAKLKFIGKGDTSSVEGIPCELIVADKNQNLNAKINTINNIQPDQVVYTNDLLMEPLDPGSTCQKVVVLDTTFVDSIGLVAIVKPERLTNIFLMHQRIQEYCKDEYQPPYTPRFDMKASRTQFFGFNIEKGRFEYSDKKYVRINGKTESDNSVEICGFEAKKVTYKPTMRPLSIKHSKNVTVRTMQINK